MTGSRKDEGDSSITYMHVYCACVQVEVISAQVAMEANGRVGGPRGKGDEGREERIANLLIPPLHGAFPEIDTRTHGVWKVYLIRSIGIVTEITFRRTLPSHSTHRSGKAKTLPNESARTCGTARQRALRAHDWLERAACSII